MSDPLDPTLERNIAYLHVIEGLNLCPFARSCRVTGMLHREVVRAEDLPAALQERVLALQTSRDGDFEVGLVIAPDFGQGPQAWEALIHQTNDRVAQLLAGAGLQPVCYAVAFHPQMAYRTETPLQLVGLLRHSPDPTLQLVRRETLDRIRDYRGEHRFLDVTSWSGPEEILAAAAELAGKVALSDRIAAANYATWQRMGGQLEAELAGCAQEAQSHRRPAVLAPSGEL